MPKHNATSAIQQFDVDTQQPKDRLLNQHQNGDLSAKDAIVLGALFEEAEHLMVANAKRLAPSKSA